MKRKWMALFLLTAFVLAFSGCSAPTQTISGMLKSAAGIKDFAFHDTFELSLQDKALSGAVTGENPDDVVTLTPDELRSLAGGADAAASVDFDGAVSASRKQMLLKLTLNIPGGTPIKLDYTANDGHYSLSENGTVIVKDGPLADLSNEIGAELSLLALGGAPDFDQIVAEIGAYFDTVGISSSATFSKYGKNGFAWQYDWQSKEGREAAAKAAADFLGVLVSNSQGRQALIGWVTDVSSDNGSLLKVLHLGPADEQDVAKVVNGPLNAFKQKAYEILLKAFDSVDLTIGGNADRDADTGVITTQTALSAALFVRVRDDEAVQPMCVDEPAGAATDELIFTVTNNLAIVPLTADAAVADGSVTTNAAKLIVKVSDDPGITERGVTVSTDSGLAGGVKTQAAKGSDGLYAVPLTSLAPDTTYYFQGYGVDSAGFTVTGPIRSFKTPAVVSSSSSGTPSDSGTVTPSSSEPAAPTVSVADTSVPTTAAPATENPKTGDSGVELALTALTGSALLLAAAGLIRRRARRHS